MEILSVVSKTENEGKRTDKSHPMCTYLVYFIRTKS